MGENCENRHVIQDGIQFLKVSKDGEFSHIPEVNSNCHYLTGNIIMTIKADKTYF